MTIMTTLTADTIAQFHRVQYVGNDPALEAGRLYTAPMNTAPFGRDENGQPHTPKWSLWNGEDMVTVTPEDLAAPDPVPFGRGTLTILTSASHRNGVGGEPFVTAIVRWVDEDEGADRRMLVTMFPTKYTTAVVDLDVAADGIIGFGANSWRGDQFDHALRATLMEPQEV